MTEDFEESMEACCRRCGTATGYHKLVINGRIHTPCIRKKPYKLRDGVDVKLGMQVWHCHPYSNEETIITGRVRFIRKWGELGLRRCQEDIAYKKVTCGNGQVVEVPIDVSFEGRSFSAGYSCFSSLENVQSFLKKRNQEREALLKCDVVNEEVPDSQKEWPPDGKGWYR